MRSRLPLLPLTVLLGLLPLAACEHSTPPVAPPRFDAVQSAGGRIAFSSSRDGNAEIYVMNADGTGLTRLTNDPASDLYPTWSPDGSRIAFTSSRDGHYNIYVMNADGTGVAQLTTSTGSVGSQAPVWCGTQIAYMSDDYISPFPDVYVMNDDGTGQTRLTISNAAFDEFPTWSPGCAQIAYTSDPGGRDQVYVMNADGSGATPLTSGSKNSHPAWSPDGTRIAFSSDRDWVGNSTEIYVMNPDGTGQTRLTANSAFHVYDFPAWSSDGTQIAFTAAVVPSPGIYVMNADGSGTTELAGDAGNRAAWFGPGAPPPPLAPMHVGDLDGATSNDGPTWSAAVTITVQDSTQAVLSGAGVTGTWSDGSSRSCTTDGSGTCSVTLPGILKRVGTVTFTVTSVTLTGRVYDPNANQDPDGDSSGTSITVTKQ